MGKEMKRKKKRRKGVGRRGKREREGDERNKQPSDFVLRFSFPCAESRF